MVSRMVLGDHLWRHIRSAGTICSATDSPEGQHLGGTDYCVTVLPKNNARTSTNDKKKTMYTATTQELPQMPKTM